MALSVKNMLGGGSIGSVENLLVPTAPTQTINGITFTNNGDGTYTLNGTSTEYIYFIVGSITLGNGTYKIVGGVNDSATNYLYLYDGASIVARSYSGYDIITVTRTTTYEVGYFIPGRTEVTNLIFKPMLTTNLKATYKEFVKRVGGFNNLISVSTSTQTVNGVTFTNNGDGTITVNGTASSTAIFDIPLSIPTVSGKYYKYTGCPKGVAVTVASNFVRLGTEQSGNKNEQGNGVIFEGNGSNITLCRIFVNGGQTVSNALFKPMLTESLLPEYYDFVNGGKDDKSKYSTKAYGLSQASLGILPTPSVAHWRGSAVVHDNKLYAFGGYTSARWNSRDVFDGTTWSSYTDAPTRFYDFACVSYNGLIHLIGGYASKSHYTFNGSTYSLVTSSIPFSTTTYCRAAVYDGCIHAFVGTTHCKYNGHTWTQVDNESETNCNVVTINDGLHRLGGGSFGAYTHKVYDGSSWTELSGLPMPVTKSCVFALNENSILIVGSSYSSTYNNYSYLYSNGVWTLISNDVSNGYTTYKYYDCAYTVYNGMAIALSEANSNQITTLLGLNSVIKEE